MKCIIVAGNSPAYNFTSADLVVRDLSQLSFLNLKKLFGEESLVEPRSSPDDGITSSSMEDQFDDASSHWPGGMDDDADDFEEAPRGMAFYR